MNHGSPSGPTMRSSMSVLVAGAVGVATSVITPAVVIRPMLMPHLNQRLPSGPLTIPPGEHPGEIGYSVITPDVVALPIFCVEYSVNHRLPSGPVVTVLPPMPPEGKGYSVMTPAFVILAIWANSTNHTLLSGPRVNPVG